MNLFANTTVNLDVLRKKAHNFRWATLPPDVIPLTAADPDFRVSQKITDAMETYIKDGYFSYCPPEGLSSFRTAISNWYYRKHIVDVDPDLILPVNSAAYGLFVIAKSILKPGENAIIPDPVDFLFRKSIEYAGATPQPLAIDKQEGTFNLEELEAKINSKTRAIFICNPNNPIGRGIPKSHLFALIHLAKKYDLWLVSDEIWADITFHDDAVTSIGHQKFQEHDKRLIISGLSKNFGLAGLRIGYIICQTRKIYDLIFHASHHSTTAFGIPGISQAAGTAALNESDDWLEEFKEHLSKMRAMTLDFIDDSPFFESVDPNATYLAFPQLKNSNLESSEIVEHILERARVALVPGGKDWFESQSEGHIRICYSTSAELLEQAYERIRTMESPLF